MLFIKCWEMMLHVRKEMHVRKEELQRNTTLGLLLLEHTPKTMILSQKCRVFPSCLLKFGKAKLFYKAPLNL